MVGYRSAFVVAAAVVIVVVVVDVVIFYCLRMFLSLSVYCA